MKLSLALISLIFFASNVGATEIAADLSLRLRNMLSKKDCANVSDSDLAKLKGRFNSCAAANNVIQKTEKSANDVAEGLLFNSLASKQLDQTQCKINNVEFFKNSPNLIKVNAEQIENKLPFIRDEMKAASLAYFEYTQAAGKANVYSGYTRNASGAQLKENLAELEKLRKKAEELETVWKSHRAAVYSAIGSLWNGNTEAMGDMVMKLAKMEPLPSRAAIEESLKNNIKSVKKEFEKNKEELLSQSSQDSGVRVFNKLSDDTKAELVGQITTSSEFSSALKDENEGMINLMCRVEGKYTTGREKLRTAVTIGTFALGGAAGLLAKVPMLVRAGTLGQVLSRAKSSAVLLGAVASGLDIGVMAESVSRACFEKNVTMTLQNACPADQATAEKEELKRIEQDNCLLQAIVGALPAGVVASTIGYKTLAPKLKAYAETQRLKSTEEAAAKISSSAEAVEKAPKKDLTKAMPDAPKPTKAAAIAEKTAPAKLNAELVTGNSDLAKGAIELVGKGDKPENVRKFVGKINDDMDAGFARLQVATKVVGRELTPKEAYWILAAHKAAPIEEYGSIGHKALREKLLAGEGRPSTLSKEETRKLIENGILGAPTGKASKASVISEAEDFVTLKLGSSVGNSDPNKRVAAKVLDVFDAGGVKMFKLQVKTPSGLEEKTLSAGQLAAADVRTGVPAAEAFIGEAAANARRTIGKEDKYVNLSINYQTVPAQIKSSFRVKDGERVYEVIHDTGDGLRSHYYSQYQMDIMNATKSERAEALLGKAVSSRVEAATKKTSAVTAEMRANLDKLALKEKSPISFMVEKNRVAGEVIGVHVAENGEKVYEVVLRTSSGTKVHFMSETDLALRDVKSSETAARLFHEARVAVAKPLESGKPAAAQSAEKVEAAAKADAVAAEQGMPLAQSPITKKSEEQAVRTRVIYEEGTKERTAQVKRFIDRMKGPDKLRAQDLEMAATLSPPERIVAARRILGRTAQLTEKEQDALLQAHSKGRGIGKYTDEDIEAKKKLLRNGGFSDKEIKILLWKGLAGKMPEEELANGVEALAKVEPAIKLSSAERAASAAPVDAIVGEERKLQKTFSGLNTEQQKASVGTLVDQAEKNFSSVGYKVKRVKDAEGFDKLEILEFPDESGKFLRRYSKIKGSDMAKFEYNPRATLQNEGSGAQFIADRNVVEVDAVTLSLTKQGTNTYLKHELRHARQAAEVQAGNMNGFHGTLLLGSKDGNRSLGIYQYGAQLDELMTYERQQLDAISALRKMKDELARKGAKEFFKDEKSVLNYQRTLSDAENSKYFPQYFSREVETQVKLIKGGLSNTSVKKEFELFNGNPTTTYHFTRGGAAEPEVSVELFKHEKIGKEGVISVNTPALDRQGRRLLDDEGKPAFNYLTIAIPNQLYEQALKDPKAAISFIESHVDKIKAASNKANASVQGRMQTIDDLVQQMKGLEKAK